MIYSYFLCSCCYEPTINTYSRLDTWKLAKNMRKLLKPTLLRIHFIFFYLYSFQNQRFRSYSKCFRRIEAYYSRYIEVIHIVMNNRGLIWDKTNCLVVFVYKFSIAIDSNFNWKSVSVGRFLFERLLGEHFIRAKEHSYAFNRLHNVPGTDTDEVRER